MRDDMTHASATGTAAVETKEWWEEFLRLRSSSLALVSNFMNESEFLVVLGVMGRITPPFCPLLIVSVHLPSSLGVCRAKV